jgi:signal transduction histidine kinase
MITPTPNLMVVDDEPEVLSSIKDLFRREAKVYTFERGSEALHALDEGLDVDVILSDHQMPAMTGVEFLRRAKERAPDATRLIITGHADLKAVIDAINHGSVWHYISKPWEPEDLLTKVRQAAGQRELIRQNRRLLAELQESNRLKSAFIEVVAHELRTPVTIVQGMADLWRITQGATAPPEDRERMEKISVASRRLAGIVERIVALLEAGKFGATIRRSRVEPAALIRQAVEDVHPFLANRAQEVRLEIDPGLGEAEIDPEKFKDILTNLLINAIKFSPDGATITVSAAPVVAGWLEFAVSDSGSGISDEHQPHLFEPFFTGFDTIHHSSGGWEQGKRGMGLGLCLVKAFVELHAGEVDCTNRPGGGTEFRFRLPRRTPGPVASEN